MNAKLVPVSCNVRPQRGLHREPDLTAKPYLQSIVPYPQCCCVLNCLHRCPSSPHKRS